MCIQAAVSVKQILVPVRMGSGVASKPCSAYWTVDVYCGSAKKINLFGSFINFVYAFVHEGSMRNRATRWPVLHHTAEI